MDSEFANKWGIPILLFIVAIIFLTIVIADYLGVCKLSSQKKENLSSLCNCATNNGQNNNIVSDQSTTNNDIDNRPVLLFFYADWCGHCQAFKPEWEKAKLIINNSDLQDTIILQKINCEENATICEQANIKGFPTIMLQNSDGTTVQYTSYPRTAESLLDFIQINTR